MTDTVISVQNISKMYPLYDNPRDRLNQSLWHALPKFMRGKPRQFYREFWALRDISFNIKQGETWGLIGRNGSGKSTLLQIIAGTTAPTTGTVQVNGRVAALLELGSGFNPEFTGRENVYLNGAVWGLSRTETENLYDDIVAFADIGDFINQPVKLYSSGMKVRLAFAVQAFVPKEVLIVDEALSVGDIFFQAKCVNQMQKMLDDGVTVLFVSHDVGAIKSFCQYGLLLDDGQMVEIGSVEKVTETYMESMRRVSDKDGIKISTSQEISFSLSHPALENTSAFQKRASFRRVQNGQANFINVQLLNQNEQEITYVEYEQPIILRMAIEICDKDILTLLAGYHIRDKNGVNIIYSDSAIENREIYDPRPGERYIIDWHFKAVLASGKYNVAVVLSIPQDLENGQVHFCDFVPVSLQFEMAPRPQARLYGAVHWDNALEIKRLE
ncbi:MAG: ABC transporter ATP-binding protein [Anaerolineae bacterium]|nr:ABC transporter ATP-binding protein [Anaerolineae bacterium]